MGKVSPQRSPQETRRQRARRTRRPWLTVGKASPIALRQVPLPPREFPPLLPSVPRKPTSLGSQGARPCSQGLRGDDACGPRGHQDVRHAEGHHRGGPHRDRRIHRVLRGVHGLEGPVTCEEIERYRNAETHWKSNRRQRRSGDAQGRGRSLERHRIDPGVRAHRR